MHGCQPRKNYETKGLIRYKGRCTAIHDNFRGLRKFSGVISAGKAMNGIPFLTTKITKDTKGSDNYNSELLAFVSFVVKTILSSLVAALPR